MIVLLTGPAGAGKTTVAGALALRRARSVVIPLDELREWVVSGRAEPDSEDREEVLRQFAIAHRNAARLAGLYADAGFDVLIEGSIPPPAIPRDLLPNLEDRPIMIVALTPTAEAAMARNAARTTKTSEVQKMLAGWLPEVCETWQTHTFPRGWIVMDSSEESIEETVGRLESALFGEPLDGPTPNG